MTHRAAVVYQLRKDGGGGVLWVHRPRGTWRRVEFRRLVDVLGWLGAATTVPLPGCLLVAQTTPSPKADCPSTLPRPGPAPVCPQAP